MGYLNDAEHKLVSAAVAAAEEHTAGEIVTVLAERSDGYSDIQLAWAVLASTAALAFLALFPAATGYAVARTDYNAAVEQFNAMIRRFPTNLTAKMFGLGKARDYYEATAPNAEEAPKVQF